MKISGEIPVADAQPLIVVGGGGHAKVLIDLALAQGRKVLGFVDRNPSSVPGNILGAPLLGDDGALGRFDAQEVMLVCGIGSTEVSSIREMVFQRLMNAGYRFAALIHPNAVIGRDVLVSDGAVIMAGAVLQAGVRVGINAIVNTRASVDHDCIVGDHAHIAPGAVLSGQVVVGASAHLGTGAVVIQGVTIGSGAFVAAGSVVVKSVPAQARVRGVPAREC